MSSYQDQADDYENQIAELRKELQELNDRLDRAVEIRKAESRERDDDLLVMARVLRHALLQRTTIGHATVAVGNSMLLQPAEEMALFELVERRERRRRGRATSSNGDDDQPSARRS